MATIHKLTKDGNTIFPATITDAVVHPSTSKTLTSMIKEYNVSELFPTEGISGGNTYTLSLAIQALSTHLRAEEKTGGIKLTFISNNKYVQYRLMTTSFSTSVADWVCEVIPSVQIQTGETVAIAPNILNLWEVPMSTLTISLLPEIAGCINEYMVQFTCPQNAATNLTLPNTIRWINGNEFELEAGYTYQISIIDNLAVYAGWEAVYNE